MPIQDRAFDETFVTLYLVKLQRIKTYQNWQCQVWAECEQAVPSMIPSTLRHSIYLGCEEVRVKSWREQVKESQDR